MAGFACGLRRVQGPRGACAATGVRQVSSGTRSAVVALCLPNRDVTNWRGHGGNGRTNGSDPTMPPARTCVRAPGSGIEFVEFVQWIADRQLGAASELARKFGMKVGLYLDVAVGVQPDGFDAWRNKSRSPVISASVRPLHPLNTAGQSWVSRDLMRRDWNSSLSRPLQTCCALRCGTPARSGSTMYSA